MMKRKLDAARIEEARRTTIKSDTKEAERREIQETIILKVRHAIS